MSNLMTMETLREIIRKAAKENSNKIDYDELDVSSSEEFANMAVEDIVSEELLSYINENIRYHTVCDLIVTDYDFENIAETAVEAELALGHDTEFLPKLSDEELFLIGEEDLGGGSDHIYGYEQLHRCFVTSGGSWYFAHYYRVIDEDNFELGCYKPTPYHRLYNLDFIKEFIPDKYKAILYDFE